MSKRPAIAINLGSTSTEIGIHRNGHFEPITYMGQRKIPMYVAFIGEEILIGDVAKRQAAKNPVNTIFDINYLIGRQFKDPVIQSGMRYWPFKLKNIENVLNIEISDQNSKQLFSPNEILSIFLTKLKENVNMFLGGTYSVIDAVIAVPTSFNTVQRRSVKKSSLTAGFNVLRIINKAMAAAITHGLDRESAVSDVWQNILVFHFGGDTLDVSVFNTFGLTIECKSVASGSLCGGKSVDDCLMIDNPLMDCHGNPISFETAITRACFEELGADLFSNIIAPVQKVLGDLGLLDLSIDDVVLIGESNEIMKFEKFLQHFFKGKVINKTINTDIAVVHGAAVQGAIINGSMVAMDLFDIIPSSIGVKVLNGLNHIIIDRKQSLPAEGDFNLKIKSSNEPIELQVFEGEHRLSDDNKSLGKFSILLGDSHSRFEVLDLQISFDVDEDGIFSVTASETCSTDKFEITETSA